MATNIVCFVECPFLALGYWVVWPISDPVEYDDTESVEFDDTESVLVRSSKAAKRFFKASSTIFIIICPISIAFFVLAREGVIEAGLSLLVRNITAFKDYFLKRCTDTSSSRDSMCYALPSRVSSTEKYK